MTPEDNRAKMEKFESMGVDVKFIGSSKLKMHHKFATVDTYSDKPVLITGSANWSMLSQRQFNENTLFFEGKPGITNNFQNQFDLLWTQAKEIGMQKFYLFNAPLLDLTLEEGISCLLYTSPSPRDQRGSRMPSSA